MSKAQHLTGSRSVHSPAPTPTTFTSRDELRLLEPSPIDCFHLHICKKIKKRFMPQSADQAAYMVWGEVTSSLPDGYDWLQKSICSLAQIFSEYLLHSSLLQIWAIPRDMPNNYRKYSELKYHQGEKYLCLCLPLDTSWVSHSWVHLTALAFHFNLIIFMFYWLLEINVSVMCSDNLYAIYSIFSCLYKRVIRDLTCINMSIEIWIFSFSTHRII